MIGPSGTFQAPKQQDKPTCKVRGVIEPGAMCRHVIVGGKYCGFGGHCEHKSVAEMIINLVKSPGSWDKKWKT